MTERSWQQSSTEDFSRMNIIVRTFEGKCIVRPDTTWERDNEDLYLPEFINSVSYTPVFFARISKPGRSIGERFAARYHEGINFGVLLYPDDFLDGSPEGFAEASCLDHTSFLPFPVHDEMTLGQAGEGFKLFRGSELIFSNDECSIGSIEKAIANASRRIYFRSGDLICIELAPKQTLCSRNDNDLRISASFRDLQILDFRLIF